MKKGQTLTIESFEEFVRLRFIDAGARPARDWFAIEYISVYKRKTIKIRTLVSAGALKKDKQIYLSQESTWETAFETAQIRLIDRLKQG